MFEVCGFALCRFWMSQLELEYHDLLSLFEFLDNGDGEITRLNLTMGIDQTLQSSAFYD